MSNPGPAVQYVVEITESLPPVPCEDPRLVAKIAALEQRIVALEATVEELGWNWTVTDQAKDDRGKIVGYVNSGGPEGNTA